jgi:hypothetical protein
MSTDEAARKAREKYEARHKKITLRIPLPQYQEIVTKSGGNPQPAIAGALSEVIEKLINGGDSERQQLIEKVRRLEAQISALTDSPDPNKPPSVIPEDAIAEATNAVNFLPESGNDDFLTDEYTDTLFDEG